MKLFLDTNILIDKLANRQPFVQELKTLCMAKFFGDVELYVSAYSYLDALFVLRKYANQAELRKRCIESLQFFDICDVDKSSLRTALESKWPDVEDFVVAQLAKDICAQYLITRDKDGFRNSSVQALSPGEFIEILRDEYGIEYEGAPF